MARRSTKSVVLQPLPGEVLQQLRAAILGILAHDEKLNREQDFDSSTLVLNQIHQLVDNEKFEAFAQIIADCNDPDFRSPK